MVYIAAYWKKSRTKSHVNECREVTKFFWNMVIGNNLNLYCDMMI